MTVSVIALKMPKVRLLEKARASINTPSKIHFLTTVVHKLFLVEGVFAKELDPMLI